MDQSQSSSIITTSPRLAEMSNGLCYELIRKMLSFLPLTTAGYRFDHANDCNLLFSRVSKNFLTVGRTLAFRNVILKTEKDTRRFIATLESNVEFVKRNPGWPSMNSTRSLALGESVGGLSHTSLIIQLILLYGYFASCQSWKSLKEEESTIKCMSMNSLLSPTR
jgi:hypothetical protein